MTLIASPPSRAIVAVCLRMTRGEKGAQLHVRERETRRLDATLKFKTAAAAAVFDNDDANPIRSLALLGARVLFLRLRLCVAALECGSLMIAKRMKEGSQATLRSRLKQKKLSRDDFLSFDLLGHGRSPHLSHLSFSPFASSQLTAPCRPQHDP